VTNLPTWAIYAVSFGSPAAAFLGATLGPLVNRRSARELEARSLRELREHVDRSRREEANRNFRWAIDTISSGSDNPAIVDCATEIIRTLLESGSLSVEDRRMLLAAGEVILGPTVEDYHRAQDHKDLEEVEGVE